MRIDLQTAAERLKKGEVVAIPTETVYGLAARYDDLTAIQAVFDLKKRPASNPLIIHLPDPESIAFFVESVPKGFKELAETFWPGPMTLVLPIKEGSVPKTVTAGLNTQAFRVPDHPITEALLKMTGPLVAPSANLSGRPSAVDPSHVEEDFGIDFPVLDGGRCSQGVESTILIYHEGRWKAGRLGAIPLGAFAPLLGYTPALSIDSKKPLCPGQHFRHYAPRAKLSFHHDLKQAPAIIGFSGREYPADVPLFLLGTVQDPSKASYELYALLRSLDRQEIKEAWIDADLPEGELWETVRERLKKAASS